jgi:hypothetical protein
LGVGQPGTGDRPSVLKAAAGKPLDVKVRAAGLLAAKPRDDIRNTSLDQKPYWHIERARTPGTNQVNVELIVDGRAVESKPLTGDGKLQDLSFQYTPKKSCWMALRIFPSSHTNPVFVEVDDKPIRASRKSAQWCLDAVDVCWNAKKGAIRASEQAAAVAAFDVARVAYKKILAECTED